MRALEAETEEEVSEILEHIRTNGYELIAIEGRTHEARKRNGRLLDNVWMGYDSNGEAEFQDRP